VIAHVKIPQAPFLSFPVPAACSCAIRSSSARLRPP